MSDDPSPLTFKFGKDVALGFVVGGTLGAAVGTLVDTLERPGLWEAIFSHNVAWEYFQSDDCGEAVLEEVFCGKRWFKFRHLDEVFINRQLEAKFGANGPYLVLGHSHEPRHDAWNPAKGRVASRYLNSGAAGRFENLIWCVEIIDGVPQVAAWHRPDGPGSGRAPERRVYAPTHSETTNQGWLVPSIGPVDLPPPPSRDDAWLVPVIHMMMP